jgi:3-phytase/alkaline phosphatase D
MGRIVGKISAWTVLSLALAVGAGHASGPAQFDLLGEAVVPAELQGSAAPVGGLSGLSCLPATGRCFAISDDHSQFAPARLYEVALELREGRLAVAKAVAETTLRQADGSPFAHHTIDPESLARTAEGHWIVASEGWADSGLPAALLEFTDDGEWVGSLRLPRALRPREGAGVRHNQALESVAISPNGRWLFTATESALRQDGLEATPEAGSPSRLLKIDLATRRVAFTYLYLTEPIAETPEDGAFAVNGLVDLLALDGERLLALERSFTVGKGNTVRLFLVDLSSSRARRGGRRAARLPVAKRLLLDVATLGVEPDNLEGMAFGPVLADGRRTLWLMADNNFNTAKQRSQVLALALGRELTGSWPEINVHLEDLP